VIRLHVTSPTAAAVAMEAIKVVATQHPGPHVVEIHADGRVLRLGPQWRVGASDGLLSGLAEFGTVTVHP
jgi:hypothetical protein